MAIGCFYLFGASLYVTTLHEASVVISFFLMNYINQIILTFIFLKMSQAD